MLTSVAPWVPVALLSASTGVAFLLKGREFGMTLSAYAWISAAVVAGLASTRTPRVMLIALVFFVPIALYFRYDTWLGHALPSVFAAAVLVGVSLSKEAAWGQLLRGSRRFVATAVLAFALLLGLSMVLVLLQRSPAVLGLLGRGEASGLFASGWTELRPQNTFPIVRGGGFLLGPVAGLAFLSFMTHTRREGDGGLGREDLLAALLLTSALNLVIAFGQIYVAGFPVESLYPSPAGLFHNPVGLAQLMTLAAPIALALSLRPTQRRWLRSLALVTVVLVAVVFIPIQQRSAHLGVTTGVVGLLMGSAIIFSRKTGKDFRRIVVTAAVASVLLAAGLAGAYLRTPQWQQSRAAISEAPTSVAWLGIGLRGETNRMAFFMAGDRPLGGYGVGGFETALGSYYDRYDPIERRWNHALLNHPLHMVVDFGVFGLAANVLVFGAFLWPGRRRSPSADSTDGNREVDVTNVGCVSAVGALLFLSIWTGEWLYDASISIPAFMLLALVASTWAHSGREGLAVPAWMIVALPLGHALMFALAV